MFGTNAITKNHLVGAAVGIGVSSSSFLSILRKIKLRLMNF